VKLQWFMMCNVVSASCEQRPQKLGPDQPLRCRLSQVRILSSIKSHVKSFNFVPRSQVQSLRCHQLLLYNQYLLAKCQYAFFAEMKPDRSPPVQISVSGLSVSSMPEAIKALQNDPIPQPLVPKNPNTSLVFH
jgi:hypothetical protein